MLIKIQWGLVALIIGRGHGICLGFGWGREGLAELAKLRAIVHGSRSAEEEQDQEKGEMCD